MRFPGRFGIKAEIGLLSVCYGAKHMAASPLSTLNRAYDMTVKDCRQSCHFTKLVISRRRW
jgi:hypothetical protein